MLQNANGEIYEKTAKPFDRKSGKPSLIGAKQEAGRGLQAAWTLICKGLAGVQLRQEENRVKKKEEYGKNVEWLK